MDVPGFMVGTKVEQAGIIRHGAKMLYAVSRATVPKVTVVIRKAYGAGYYVMCGKAYEPDLIVAWPSAEISVMGPEGAVNIIFRKQIEAAEDPDATRAEMIEGIRKTIDPYIAAGNALIDDVIDPRETRPTVIRALEMAATKRVRAAVEEARRHAGMSEPTDLLRVAAGSSTTGSRSTTRRRDEVYVGFWKKHTGKRAMTWSEAVDQALCFGWIDGERNTIDDERHMQRFTPRKPGSNWSKINVEKVAKLKEAGLMRPAGTRRVREANRRRRRASTRSRTRDRGAAAGVRGAAARERGGGRVLRLRGRRGTGAPRSIW